MKLFLLLLAVASANAVLESEPGTMKLFLLFLVVASASAFPARAHLEWSSQVFLSSEKSKPRNMKLFLLLLAIAFADAWGESGTMKLFLLLLAVAYANAIGARLKTSNHEAVSSSPRCGFCQREDAGPREVVRDLRVRVAEMRAHGQRVPLQHGRAPLEWTCVLAKSKEQCMKWVDLGYADVVMTKGEDIYTGMRNYHLKPILYELPELKQLGVSKHMKSWESISLAVVPKSSPISTWRDLEGKTTCHASVYEPTSFKLPVCHMIHHNIIPHKGNMMESFVHFFEKSCVPGILKSYLNYNRTIPSTLCELCGSEDRQYCHEYLDKYSGLEGASRCLTEGKGQVTFLPHHYIDTFMDKFGRDYKLVCRDNTEELENWHVKSCHMGYLPRPTLLCSHKASEEYINTLQTLLINAVKSCHMGYLPRPTLLCSHKASEEYINTLQTLLINAVKASEEYINTLQTLLINAVKTFSSKVTTFDMFSSDVDSYYCRGQLKKDLIFQDNCRDLVRIDSEKQFAKDFFQIYDTCHALKPKPTARFCVYHQESYHKCLSMQKYFMKTEKVNEISWGCVLATSQLECMKMVHNGTCDIVSTDAMQTFIGGKEFLLQPFMSQYFDVFETPIDGKKVYDHNIYTYTVGVMLKDTVRRRFGHHETYVNLKDLNTCHAGISHPSSFQYPIGWLLANGTIPRIGSIFESVDKYFKHSCLPGVMHWNMTKDLILGYEFNYGYNQTFFANFTDWYMWNIPSTWTWFTYQNVTPSFMRHFYPIEKEIEHYTQYTTLPYFKDMPVELISKLKAHVPVSFYKHFIHPLTQHLKFYDFHDKETPVFTPEYIKEMLTPELMKSMITPEFLKTIFTPEILHQLDIPKHLMSVPTSTRAYLHRKYHIPHERAYLHRKYHIPHERAYLHRKYRIPIERAYLHRKYHIPHERAYLYRKYHIPHERAYLHRKYHIPHERAYLYRKYHIPHERAYLYRKYHIPHERAYLHRKYHIPHERAYLHRKYRIPIERAYLHRKYHIPHERAYLYRKYHIPHERAYLHRKYHIPHERAYLHRKYCIPIERAYLHRKYHIPHERAYLHRKYHIPHERAYLHRKYHIPIERAYLHRKYCIPIERAYLHRKYCNIPQAPHERAYLHRKY
ncbi:antigen p97 [Branchiostoma belcheri]|nr:antigen p97 [Branchiostoma belcheri]